jgi:transposase
MIRGRKHSKAEIAAKLAQADDLARQGMLQNKVAHALGVSVMTLHRWRKLAVQSSATSVEQYEVSRFQDELSSNDRIAELEAENARLRRLVTDLLLEKLKLEEAAHGGQPPPKGKTRLK